MAIETTNLGLNMDGEDDFYDIERANQNLVKIDAAFTTIKSQFDGRIIQLESDIKVLRDATLNNMTSNVFIETFGSLDSIKLSKGVYDPVARKIYV